MSSELIPSATRTAAARGFIRTATQSLASAIPTTAIAIGTTGQWALGVGLGAAGAVATAALAGTASYLSILSKGVPGDYAVPGAGLTSDERSVIDDLRLIEGRAALDNPAGEGF